jgi:hypothetical protein
MRRLLKKDAFRAMQCIMMSINRAAIQAKRRDGDFPATPRRWTPAHALLLARALFA